MTADMQKMSLRTGLFRRSDASIADLSFLLSFLLEIASNGHSGVFIGTFTSPPLSTHMTFFFLSKQNRWKWAGLIIIFSMIQIQTSHLFHAKRFDMRNPFLHRYFGS